MDARLHALNRFGLGARPGERQRLSDLRGWLKSQLSGGPPSMLRRSRPDRVALTLAGPALQWR